MTTAYKIDPAKDNKFGTTDLTSLSRFSYDYEGDEVTHGSDGQEFVGGVYVDNKRYRVTVTGSDNSVTLEVGDAKTLILNAIDRANGSGAGSDSKIFTFTNAVCVSTNSVVNHDGISETQMVFVVPGKEEAGDYVDPLAVT